LVTPYLVSQILALIFGRSERYFLKALSKVNCDIGAKLSNFLATGNLVSPTGLDLQQASGFTIIAEKLNWQRYISHFRCIHRGAFFAELKTTTVRKLLPEAWGKYLDIFPIIQSSKSFSRFPLPGTHSGWIAMRSPESFVKDLSHCYQPSFSCTYSWLTRCPWYDSSVYTEHRWAKERMRTTRRPGYRLGSPHRCCSISKKSTHLENGRQNGRSSRP